MHERQTLVRDPVRIEGHDDPEPLRIGQLHLQSWLAGDRRDHLRRERATGDARRAEDRPGLGRNAIEAGRDEPSQGRRHRTPERHALVFPQGPQVFLHEQWVAFAVRSTKYSPVRKAETFSATATLIS